MADHPDAFGKWWYEATKYQNALKASSDLAKSVELQEQLLQQSAEAEERRKRERYFEQQTHVAEQARKASLPKCAYCQSPLEGDRPKRCSTCRSDLHWIGSKPLDEEQCHEACKAPHELAVSIAYLYHIYEPFLIALHSASKLSTAKSGNVLTVCDVEKAAKEAVRIAAGKNIVKLDDEAKRATQDFEKCEKTRKRLDEREGCLLVCSIPVGVVVLVLCFVALVAWANGNVALSLVSMGGIACIVCVGQRVRSNIESLRKQAEQALRVNPRDAALREVSYRLLRDAVKGQIVEGILGDSDEETRAAVKYCCAYSSLREWQRATRGLVTDYSRALKHFDLEPPKLFQSAEEHVACVTKVLNGDRRALQQMAEIVRAPAGERENVIERMRAATAEVQEDHALNAKAFQSLLGGWLLVCVVDGKVSKNETEVVRVRLKRAGCTWSTTELEERIVATVRQIRRRGVADIASGVCDSVLRAGRTDLARILIEGQEELLEIDGAKDFARRGKVVDWFKGRLRYST